MDQKHGKNLNFLTFWTSWFYSLEKRFFVLEYRKIHFPGLYCLKKKLGERSFLYQNRGLTPLKNVNFLTFLSYCFYSLERRFIVLKYRKRHFPGLYSPPPKKAYFPYKKKSGKITNFWPKPWTSPFEEIPIFGLFELLVFIV